MLQAEISSSRRAASGRPGHGKYSDVPHGARGGVCEQRFSFRCGLAQRAFEQSIRAGADSASGIQRKHFSGRRDLSRRKCARAAGLQFDLVSQRPAGCRIAAAARHGMEPAASGDAVGPHARHQRAQSRRAQSPARRYRSRLHRGRPAGAADFGARTKRAQNSDHRLQSSRFQFSAGVGVSVADGRERRVDDAFRRRSCGLALHGRDRSSRSGDENYCAVRKRSAVCAQGRGRSPARARKPECTGSSRRAAKQASP